MLAFAILAAVVSLLVSIIFLTVTLVLASKVSNQQERIAKLEAAQLRVEPMASSIPAGSLATTSTQPNTLIAQQPPTVSAESKPNLAQDWTSFDIGSWLAADWQLKLGALLLLIAVGWFVTYAFMNNWIGPIGRISLGLAAGAGLIGFAEWWQRRSPAQATILLALGGATALVTLFAARTIYDMFTPLIVILIANVIALVIAASSYQKNLQSRAIVSVLMALIVPLLTNSPASDYFALLSYIAAVTTGYALLVWVKGWLPLSAVLFGGVLFYLVPLILMESDSEQLRAIFTQFSIYFTGIFFTLNIATLLRSRQCTVWNLLTGTGIGFFSLFWSLQLLPPHWESLALADCSLIFLLASFAAFRVTGNRNPVVVYAAVAVLLLGSALTVELEGPTLVVSLTLLALIVTLVGGKLLEKPREGLLLGFLFIIPGVLSLPYMITYDWTRAQFPIGNFAALVTLTLALFLVAATYRQQFLANVSPDQRPTSAPFDIAGLVYGLILIWLINTHFFSDDIATAFSLIIFSTIAIGLYVAGKLTHGKVMKYTGITLLGFVVLRLLSVEVWQMPITGRIITFAFIGIILITTALFERNLLARFNQKV